MSTINLSGIEFTVKYVDPSIASAGDGTAPLSALSDLPEFSGLQNNTAYLIRRLGDSYKLTFPTGESPTSSLNYAFIGMPKSTDPMYEMIPSEVKTAWDDDSSSVDYAYTKASSNGFALSGSNIIFNSYRLYFYHSDLTTEPQVEMFKFSSTDYTNLITFENCRFGYLGYELDSDRLSVSASEINESKSLLYKAAGSGDQETNDKYYLYAGTEGETNAVYYNLSLTRKIYYDSSTFIWLLCDMLGNTTYFYSSGITGSWSSFTEGNTPPIISKINESLSYKIEVGGSTGKENGKYYVSSGTPGTIEAKYTNGSYTIYYDTDKWYMKPSGSSSAEYTGPYTDSPFGDYTKSASWSSVPSYGMKGYVSCGKIRSFEMRGCKINFNANCNSSYNATMCAITMSDKKNCSISNTDANIVCATNNQGIGNIFKLCTYSGSSNYDNENYTHLYGLTFNLFKCATSSNQTNYIPFCVLDRNSSFVEAKNISVSMSPQNQIGSGTVTTLEAIQNYDSSLNCALGVFVLDKVHNFDIDGVTISLPQFWKVGMNSSYDSSSLFIVRSNDENYMSESSSSSPGQMNIIKNITISCAQGAGEGTYDGLDSSNATGDYYSNISNSTFARPMSCIRLYNSSKHIWDISSISISNPHGVAAEIYGCWFEASSVSGTIRAGSNSTVNIASLSTWYAGKAIGIFGNATVKVDALTCGTGGTSNPADELACLGEIYSSQGFLYVGTSNRRLLMDVRNESSLYSNAYSAICANEIYPGRYMVRTENYLCSTYGTFRTSPQSSVSATLKLQNNWCNSASTGLVLGQSPFGGFQKTISSSGKQVLYIYGATLDLGSKSDVFAAIGKNIIVEVIIPTSNGKRSVFSTSGSWVLDTTSTWSDSNISATDSDATGFPVYLKLPLNIDAANSSVDIKIYYNWYSSNGAFFLDPFFSVSAS